MSHSLQVIVHLLFFESQGQFVVHQIEDLYQTSCIHGLKSTSQGVKVLLEFKLIRLLNCAVQFFDSMLRAIEKGLDQIQEMIFFTLSYLIEIIHSGFQ